MSGFWRKWFLVWCLSLGIFGAVLSGGAFETASGPVHLILSILQGSRAAAFDPPLQFSLGVMGAVSIGWTVMLYFIVSAASDLKDRGRPLWNAMSAGIVSWFIVDSTLSVITGFGLNVVTNIAWAGMYVVGLIGSGALKRSG